MEAHFWHKKWESNQIGFHEDEVNALLVSYLDRLALNRGARIFLPLCGKTHDIAWLLENGYQVLGVELSEIAIKQLFEALDRVPVVTEMAALKHYHAEGIDIYVGDIFELSATLLGKVDAIYDRAALVALPPETRIQYTEHLRQITGTAPQLLVCIIYDQAEMKGPPFSIVTEEVQRHYAKHYTLAHLDTQPVEGGLKGVEATEMVWLLS